MLIKHGCILKNLMVIFKILISLLINLFALLCEVSTRNVKLVMNSLDTVGYLEINNRLMLTFFDNMFVKKEIRLKDLVELDKENEIKILFFSPIEYTEERAKKFKVINFKVFS